MLLTKNQAMASKTSFRLYSNRRKEEWLEPTVKTHELGFFMDAEKKFIRRSLKIFLENLEFSD